jgi:hypothetical protein
VPSAPCSSSCSGRRPPSAVPIAAGSFGRTLFFTLNLVLTLATIAISEDYYGVGYFLACLLSSFAALVLADRTFTNLNFLTFIGNNPTIRQSTASKLDQRALIVRLLARRN